MFTNCLKGLLCLAFAFCFVSQSCSCTVTQNYTTSILRLAKAAQIKSFMNLEKPPCQNFYKYSCEHWAKYHPTSMAKPKTSHLDELQEIYIQKCLGLLKQERKSDSPLDKMLKKFYKSCSDTVAKPSLGIEVFLDVVGFRGGWPQIKEQNWYEDDYDWLKVIANLREKLGVNILVGLEIIPDFEGKELNRIKIGAPDLSLGSRKFYLHKNYHQERENYKHSIIRKLGKYFPDVSHKWKEEMAQQILELEEQLAKGLPENEELTLIQTTHTRYANDLRAAYGNYVDLTRYLNIIFNETIYMKVYESPDDYLSNLVEVIRQTPKLTIANYTAWRVLDHLDKAQAIEKPSSEKECVQQIIKYFPLHMESLFQRCSGNMQKINELQSIWADIKRLFREDLSSSPKLNWIQSDTRQKAVQKLDAMDLVIQNYDERTLNDNLGGIHLDEKNYFENIIKVLTLQSHLDLIKVFEKPSSKIEEIKLPRYELSKNRVHVPTTFLQERFFWDPVYPHALKYSTLGVLLAQQMLQGFDALGREYDKYGHRRLWWDALSSYAFDDKAKCFKKQYEQYKYQKKDIKDPKMVETAILDNGALSISYRAYQKWFKNSVDKNLNENEVLPILGLTNNQLFFVGFAQVWCANYHESFKEFDVLPERLRVIGALANINDFPREFHCEMGNKMNPTDKCVIF